MKPDTGYKKGKISGATLKLPPPQKSTFVYESDRTNWNKLKIFLILQEDQSLESLAELYRAIDAMEPLHLPTEPSVFLHCLAELYRASEVLEPWMPSERSCWYQIIPRHNG